MTDIKDVIIENESLKARNEFLERMVKGLKLNLHQCKVECDKLCERNMELSRELQTIKQMSMFEFGNTYCSSESLEADGHAFARSLGVGK